MKQFGPALKVHHNPGFNTHLSAIGCQHIAEIIERGVREHPELSVGSNTDGIEAFDIIIFCENIITYLLLNLMGVLVKAENHLRRIDVCCAGPICRKQPGTAGDSSDRSLQPQGCD